MTRSRAELGFALGWMTFGAAVLGAAWRMDRLASLGINPWSAPGLMPGVLGALMIVFGGALALRALGQSPPDAVAEPVSRASAVRVALALALCIGYAAGLLGRGLPFWLVSAGFLAVALLLFRWLDRGAEAPRAPARLALSSAAIAICAAGAISFVFERLFFVRLP